MSVTPIRQGTHNCDLPYPEFHPEWKHRDIARCDTCGRVYQLWMPEGWAWAFEWIRVSRFYAWRHARRTT